MGREKGKRGRGIYISVKPHLYEARTEKISQSGYFAFADAATHVYKFGYLNDRRKCCVHRISAGKHLRYFRIELHYIGTLAYVGEVLPTNALSVHGFQGKLSVELICCLGLARMRVFLISAIIFQFQERSIDRLLFDAQF